MTSSRFVEHLSTKEETETRHTHVWCWFRSLQIDLQGSSQMFNPGLQVSSTLHVVPTAESPAYDHAITTEVTILTLASMVSSYGGLSSNALRTEFTAATRACSTRRRLQADTVLGSLGTFGRGTLGRGGHSCWFAGRMFQQKSMSLLKVKQNKVIKQTNNAPMYKFQASVFSFLG